MTVRTPDRAVSALEDVVAIETLAPGMVRVLTWSDVHTVDTHHERCDCPDMEYHLEGEGRCKHIHAARMASDQTDLPCPWGVTDDLSPDPDRLAAEPLPDFDEFELVADGGQVQKPEGMDQWTVWDGDRGNALHFDKRPAAEDKQAEVEQDFEFTPDIYPPGELPDELDTVPDTDDEPVPGVDVCVHCGQEIDDGLCPDCDDTKDTTAESIEGAEPVEAELVDHSPDADGPADYELPERSVSDDPLEWVPGEFVDEIDGSQAINRKGFEVLSHFYDIDVKEPEVMVGPYETDFEYCQVRATVEMPDGRECSALASAHVDRGDDPELLLEMADTRARKRALSIATGVGAVAVEELKNEVQS